MLHLKVTFYIKIPKCSEKSQLEGRYHIYKPDLSNLLKFTEDICSGILMHDDSLICSVVAKKKYSTNPRTEFEIKEL